VRGVGGGSKVYVCEPYISAIFALRPCLTRRKKVAKSIFFCYLSFYLSRAPRARFFFTGFIFGCNFFCSSSDEIICQLHALRAPAQPAKRRRRLIICCFPPRLSFPGKCVHQDNGICSKETPQDATKTHTHQQISHVAEFYAETLGKRLWSQHFSIL
jgi:hypothetical protein